MKKNILFIVIVTVGLLLVIFMTTVYLRKITPDYIPTPMDNKTSPSPSLWLKKPPTPDNVRCPADVKLCPDGTYVGRMAPSCSFVPCPN